MKPKTNHDLSAGFTLVELLIGLAISVLVMAALIDVFSSQQRVYYQQSQMAKAQAAARTALAQLSRDVRMAGFTGISLGSDMLVLSRFTNNYLPLLSISDGDTTLTSLHGTAGPMAYANTIITDLASYNVNGDVFEIRGNFGRQITTVTSSITTASTAIPVADPTIFNPRTGFNAPGWIVIGKIQNTVVVDILPITGISGNDISIGTNPVVNIPLLAGSATAGEIIWAAPMYSRVYFATDDTLGPNLRQRLMVANYLPTADNTDVVRAGDPVEFAVDIADFQVTYDTVTAAADELTTGLGIIGDPCAVGSVTMRLWTTSDKYREDRPLIRQFSTTVRVRNIGFDTFNCPL